MAEQRYHLANGAWPAEIPPLTGQEAISAAKRLYRFGMGKAWPGKVKLTSGNRYTWVRYSTLYVNPEGRHGSGWCDLVHHMSHLVHHRKYPNNRSHDPRHETIEIQMTRYVIEHGWLDGRLRREPKPKPPVQEVRYQSVVKRLAAWESKLKRAETAIKKLKRQKAYYERKENL